jgi:hypothetical protein
MIMAGPRRRDRVREVPCLALQRCQPPQPGRAAEAAAAGALRRDPLLRGRGVGLERRRAPGLLVVGEADLG